MKKTGIFYGSSTGTTAKIAHKIAEKLNVSPNDVHDVSKTSPSALGEYELIVLGSSTWGAGELQTDWIDFSKALEAMSLNGKTVAVFGCGRQMMKNTFCNAVGILYDIAKQTGANLIGEFEADCYTFKKSKAQIEDSGKMKGLVLDEDGAPQFTDKRIDEWTALIKESAE